MTKIGPESPHPAAMRESSVAFIVRPGSLLRPYRMYPIISPAAMNAREAAM